MRHCKSEYYRDIKLEGDPITDTLLDHEQRIGALELETELFANKIEILESSTEQLGEAVESIRQHDVAYVKDYGAVGNGITDDTFAIQEALDSGKHLIIFDPGTYLVSCGVNSAALYVSSNTILVGLNATILCNSFHGVAMTNKSPWLQDHDAGGGYTANHNITICNLNFACPVGNESELCLVGFTHCHDLTIQGCTFSNLVGAWHLLEINASEHVLIDNCTFKNHTTNDQFTSITEMLQIDIAYSGAFPAVGPYDATVCNDVIVSNCIFSNPQEFYQSRGFERTPAAIGSHNSRDNSAEPNVKIVGNHFENLQVAIKFRSLWNSNICNNSAENCHGFFIQDVGVVKNNNHYFRNLVISNNVLNATSVSVQQYDAYHSEDLRGVYIDTSLNSIISNNRINYCASHGIVVGGNYNKISGNNVSNCGQNGIYIWGNHYATVNGNLCVDNNKYADSSRADIVLAKSDSDHDNSEVLFSIVSGNDCGTMHVATVGTSTLIISNYIGSISKSTDVTISNTNIRNNVINATWTTQFPLS